MHHTRDKHSHRRVGAPTVGIPMIRRYTLSKIPHCRTEHKREKRDAVEEDEEIFPHFCMTCEKEFIPHDHMLLYCSESCRKIDQATTSAPATPTGHHTTANLPFYSALTPAPRDIIPQASPSRTTTVLPGSAPAPSVIGSEESTCSNNTSTSTGRQSVSAVFNLARKAAFAFQAQEGGMARCPNNGIHGKAYANKS